MRVENIVETIGRTPLIKLNRIVPEGAATVYVKAESGIGVNGSFEPVNVVGVLKAETAFTGLADAGYTLNAEKVEVFKN